MASSDYYYERYKQKRDEVKAYERDLQELRRALNNLTGGMMDEIRAVNNALDNLKYDMNQGIRHNAVFTACANEVTAQKEKTVTADVHLSVAVSELEEEISRTEQLKNDAIDDREYYYQKYREKKEEERQERQERLKNILGGGKA